MFIEILPQPIFGELDFESRMQKLHDTAFQHVSKGEYQVALFLCDQALQETTNIYGLYHPDVATFILIAALINKNQNRLEESERLLKIAFSIRQKVYGNNHPEVSSVLSKLGVLYANKREYEKAVQLFRISLGIKEKALGKEHPDVADNLNKLALINDALGNYQEAKKNFIKF